MKQRRKNEQPSRKEVVGMKKEYLEETEKIKRQQEGFTKIDELVKPFNSYEDIPEDVHEKIREIEKEYGLPQMETPKNNKLVHKVVGRVLQAKMYDPEGNMIVVDTIRIADICRFSFSVLNGELIIILPETMGEIGEQVVPILDRGGHKTGATKKVIHGEIRPYKTVISNLEEIKKFLFVFYEVQTIEELNEVFDGLTEHEKAREKITAALEQRRQEEEQKRKDKENGKGLILDSTGEVAK